MAKHAKRKKGSVLLAICMVLIVIALAVILLVIGGDRGQQPVSVEPGTTIDQPTSAPTDNAADEIPSAPAVEITPEPVSVSTTEYELTYSGLMADVISYEEIEEDGEAALAFFVDLSGGKKRTFVLKLNSEQGDIVSMLTNQEGSRIPAAFTMEALPEGLSAEDSKLFFAAQEIVNDVVASITLK